MSTPEKPSYNDASSIPTGSSSGVARDPSPTVAAFSPPSLGRSDPTSLRQRSTILVHQKSPLLVATPPQVTRTLAYSYPFIQPLNKIVGLLTWTSGDPWESFLLLAAFWAVTLYGDPVMRWGGPVVVVILLILGMYSRRFSSLSTTATAGAKGHHRTESEAMRHAKSLDEIVDNLKLFTSRCNILLDPFLRLTDLLSTQRTATSATTRPALIAMFTRILLVTPIWILLTLPPFYIITTKRLVLFVGTVALTWHCRPARVTRTILWRSRHIRRATSILTGLHMSDPLDSEKGSAGKRGLPPGTNKTANDIAASLRAKRQPSSPGIRFTFTLYENQRRWLLLGWTSSMLAYERAPWTDEHLNPMPPKELFELPDVEGGHARWRWVEGSEWHVDMGGSHTRKDSDDDDDEEGWIYYDSKWKDGRRGRDSWGRYTRRRKWCRDAELVEITPSTETTPSPTPAQEQSETEDNYARMAESTATVVPSSASTSTAVEDETNSMSASAKKRGKGWFRRRASSKAESSKSVGGGTTSSVGSSSLKSYPDEEDEYRHATYYNQQTRDEEWVRYGEDVGMQLG
ncbi:hypothetical protein, variant [Verruconis gallopava]|nr:hypothetical protein, variant [Verruconis gallopava]KIW08027.1 hypothetical protein, variant [Verruconis gallopava]